MQQQNQQQPTTNLTVSLRDYSKLSSSCTSGRRRRHRLLAQLVGDIWHNGLRDRVKDCIGWGADMTERFLPRALAMMHAVYSRSCLCALQVLNFSSPNTVPCCFVGCDYAFWMRLPARSNWAGTILSTFIYNLCLQGMLLHSWSLPEQHTTTTTTKTIHIIAYAILILPIASELWSLIKLRVNTVNDWYDKEYV